MTSCFQRWRRTLLSIFHALKLSCCLCLHLSQTFHILFWNEASHRFSVPFNAEFQQCLAGVLAFQVFLQMHLSLHLPWFWESLLFIRAVCFRLGVSLHAWLFCCHRAADKFWTADVPFFRWFFFCLFERDFWLGALKRNYVNQA